MFIMLLDRDNIDRTIEFYDAIALNTTGVKNRIISILDKEGKYHEYDLNEWNITAIN